MRLPRTLPLVLLAACTGTDEAPGETECSCPAAAVVNCGHRGTGTSTDRSPYPENTIVSFGQAVAEGADMIELDLVHSADGALVVIHDDTVDRTTDGTGCVGDMTVAELQALDAGARTALAGTGVVIPTLPEVLAAIDVDVNIELKLNDVAGCPDSDVPRLAADVVAAIAADTKERRIMVSSFDLETLAEVRRLDASVYIGHIVKFPDYYNDGVQTAVDSGFDALNYDVRLLGVEPIEELHAAGLDANAWTVNDPAQIRELVDAGVDMIITDEPEVVAAARQAWCAAYTCDAAGSGAD